MTLPKRRLVSSEIEANTREEMTRAIVGMLADGAASITNEDLGRRGFTHREIETHVDEARSQARARHIAARIGE